MKLVSRQNSLETNVQSENQEFGIGDISMVIEILRSKLYQRKIVTPVQEYISNAADAAVEAGNPRNKFEVTIPTRLSPTFKVRDFGPGITPERIKNVFVLYGNSTKRTDNKQIGGFGIGAKSAFAYTDSFTVVTYIDGTKRTYVAHIGANNQGRLDLISTDKANEKNGTEIQIAVKPEDCQEFKEAVYRAVYFWNDRPTIKGDIDAPPRVQGLCVGKHLELLKNGIPHWIESISNYYYDGKECLVVVGGIPYKLPSSLVSKVHGLKKALKLCLGEVVLHVDNGFIEISANREQVSESPYTIDQLDKLGNQLFLEIKTHIANTFSSCKTVSDWINVQKQLTNLLDYNDHNKFMGYEIKNKTISNDDFKNLIITEYTCLDRRSRKTYKVKKVREYNDVIQDKSFSLDNLHKTFYLASDENAVTRNKRIREYFLTESRIWIVESSNKINLNKVSSDLGFKDFQTLTFTNVPRQAKAAVIRAKTELCLHRLGYGRHHYVTLDANTQKYLFCVLEGGKWGNYTKEELFELQNNLNLDGYKICGVSQATAKLVENDSNFKPLQDWIDAYKPKAVEVNYVKALESDGAKEMLVKLISSLKDTRDEKLISDAKEIYKVVSSLGLGYGKRLPNVIKEKILKEKSIAEYGVLVKEFNKTIADKYPLFNHLEYYDAGKVKSELVDYINSKN